ncbi:3-deoxy-manno-octulosonate cytidylyltransferase [Striga asiatica]|uniref:3-deoxy-manno-octulosonate cytidylyltransferase n=1 Tax=Striga asiatica TaxID=4170 RepID=A0A5A7QAP9_STRAF|nr:3-deoxy-manno-octulosonate cytidylyltransferase [Striga asiatica]
MADLGGGPRRSTRVKMTDLGGGPRRSPTTAVVLQSLYGGGGGAAGFADNGRGGLGETQWRRASACNGSGGRRSITVSTSEVGEDLRNSVASNQDTLQGVEKDSSLVETRQSAEKTSRGIEEGLIPCIQAPAQDPVINSNLVVSNLVEVAIQPSTSGNRVNQRKNTTFSRKARNTKQDALNLCW